MAYKARPITSKACSPYKSDANLIDGARNMAKSTKFVNHGEGMEEKVKSSGTATPTNHGLTQSEDEKEFENTPATETSTEGQADNAVEVPETKKTN